MAEEKALKWLDEKKCYLENINDTIWEFAEVGLQEFKSAELLAGELEKAGFAVEKGVAGMPTAFVATWGSGKPKIGFLAEYDALPHLSQKVSTKKEPVVDDAPGHGCGHNTYGAAVLGTVLALKEQMEEEKIGGTIVFYGCPAEETLVGKVFMARDGLFDDLDCALTWHPMTFNTVWEGSSMAMNSAKFTFYGRSAHAAANPEQGRSALDAVELMNTGVNFLREHVISDARLHYVITKGGGEPNVVPPEAQSWYYVRAPRRKDVDEIFARVMKIAEGATLMTETTMKMEMLVGCYNMLPNRVLGQLLYESLKKIGPPTWTEEEIQFAKELTGTFAPGQKETVFRVGGAPMEYLEKYLDDTICPPYDKGRILAGSTDVSDVSWVTPTAQITTACGPLGMAGHSWQFVATSGMSIAHKGMMLAAKALAVAGLELLRKPDIIEAAQAEFKQSTKGQPYECAMPPEAKPPLDQLPKHDD